MLGRGGRGTGVRGRCCRGAIVENQLYRLAGLQVSEDDESRGRSTHWLVSAALKELYEFLLGWEYTGWVGQDLERRLWFRCLLFCSSIDLRSQIRELVSFVRSRVQIIKRDKKLVQLVRR